MSLSPLVHHLEIRPRPEGERSLDLFDLVRRPRALPVLAAMGRLGRPFTSAAFEAAAGYTSLRAATLLAEDLERWGLVEIDVPDAEVAPYFVRTTHLGRRVGALAHEIQRQLLDSPARFKGDRLITAMKE